MSSDRQALVEQAIKAMNARSWEMLDALMHSEFELHSAMSPLEGGPPRRNAEEVLDLIRGFDAVWDDLRYGSNRSGTTATDPS